MSHYDYEMSKKISQLDPPFYSLIMSAMRQADTENLHFLKTAFPDTWEELKARYNAPGGFLSGEEKEFEDWLADL